jgi:hypothetical protein
MTKADVILSAAENGASDEDLLVLEQTDESEFAIEVEEEDKPTDFKEMDKKSDMVGIEKYQHLKI